jgi:ATP-dependent helicase Lhr and Lhr-like helicase
VSAFDRLHPALQHHVVNSLGWRDLRPVQNLTIDAFLDGSNLVVLAPTAGGKTEAAFFPILSRMLTEAWDGLSVLYVSPIRALLNNQQQRLERYFGLVGRRVARWHGDTPQSEKRRIVADHPDCLLTTPESLEVILVSSKIDHRSFFRSVRVVVIDELHSFAGDDRGWHLLSVLSRIQKFAGRDIQRVGLSATVGNPAVMLQWLSCGSKREGQVVQPPPAEKNEPEVQVDFVSSLGNAAKIIRLLHRGEKRLVFCDSRSRVEQLALLLREQGVETYISHSSLGVEERRQAEKAFAQRQNCVIVATSSLELGIDVGDLDRVIQIDAPSTVSSFLQRMGRTGRREGYTSNCLFLATTDEALLRATALVRLWATGFVEPVKAPPAPYHILAQQLMALCLQERGIGRSDWLGWLGSVPAFIQLDAAKVSSLVDSMIASHILWSDQGILSFAPEGEAKYGRKNFMELLSVFTSPPLFHVMCGRKELGFVHESTFFKRDANPTILILAGRCWKATNLDWRRRIAHVEPTDQKGKSRWLGEGQFLSYRVCQSMREILANDSVASNWSQRTTSRLGELRQEFPWVHSDSTALIRHSDGDLRWWTFAGGVPNTILGTQLQRYGKTQADNVSIKLEGNPLPDEIRKYLAALLPQEVDPVSDPVAIEKLKFSESLPPALATEVFCTRFNDAEAIQNVLGEPIRSICEA